MKSWICRPERGCGNGPATGASIASCIRTIRHWPPFIFEHVIPKVHGGTDDLENLALACIDCNLHKGTNLTGVDPETRQITNLFHPRHERWEEHFAWQGNQIVGRSAIGRTTVRVLQMNSEDQLALRSV